MTTTSINNQTHLSRFGYEALIIGRAFIACSAEVVFSSCLTIANRLSLEPMLFGWGVNSPAAFIGLEQYDETGFNKEIGLSAKTFELCDLNNLF